MKLTYRGVSYEYNPPVVEIEESNVGGQYRGLDWRFRNAKRVLVLDSDLDLKYRGVAYRPTVQLPVTISSESPNLAEEVSVQDKARSLMLDHLHQQRNRQQTMLTRLAAEVRVSA